MTALLIRAALVLLPAAILLCPASSARADEPLLFESGPQRIFQMKCSRCHGDDRTQRKAELNLQTIAGVRRGSVSGPVVSPGNLEQSLLWKKVSSGEMPPGEEDRLYAEQLNALRDWIAQGAKSKVSLLATATAVTDEERAFWSFQPLPRLAESGSIPTAADVDSAATPVDSFLLARLEQHALAFSPPAEKPVLIRRLSLDLLGLPPTPEEVQEFVADSSPDAYARLVDRLLSSPHYGERWGRHWLDVAGYSDSNGYHRADTPRPFAYRYRDYIVRAFNDDKPYDRFWIEQLAGDELYDLEQHDGVNPEVNDAIVATHFLRNAPDGTDSTEGNEMVRTIERYAVLEQQLQITISGMFGLTVDCARCHSHKFDPIPQTDYYALQAVFYPAFNVKDWLPPAERFTHIATPKQLAEWEARTQEFDAKIAALKQTLAALTSRNPPQENDPSADELQKKRGDVEKEIKETESRRPEKPGRIAWVSDLSPTAPGVPLLKRGRYFDPGPPVAPAGLSVLSQPGAEFDAMPRAAQGRTTGRRLAFAQWATQRKSRAAALLARVQVNRIWMWHFGRGLVETPDNFGALGARPSHPELLDWLAAEYVQSGWSLKHLQRLIVTSNAYRQSTTPTAHALAVDRDNRLLWGFPPRRLESEAIRDSMLAVSGLLNRSMGGPPVEFSELGDRQIVVPIVPAAGLHPGNRRSLYLRQRRSTPVTFLQTFDQAAAEPNCPKRSTSTVVSQGLALLNSEFAVAAGESFAGRVQQTAGTDRGAQVELAWLLAYSRIPTPEERQRALAFLDAQQKRHLNREQATPRLTESGSMRFAESGTIEYQALSDLCQTLLASSEFLYQE